MNSVENCPRVEALSALADGELAAAERIALEAHLAGCAICAPLLSEFRELRSGFAQLPALAPGVDLAALVDRRIGASSAAIPQRPRPRRQWWRLVPAGFGAALSLSAGVYLGGMLIPAARLAPNSAAMQMAAFAATPPGALCPALKSCNPSGY